MLIKVVELRTSCGFCRWGFCISFIHSHRTGSGHGFCCTM